jgi:hypothetical protein
VLSEGRSQIIEELILDLQQDHHIRFRRALSGAFTPQHSTGSVKAPYRFGKALYRFGKALYRFSEALKVQ